MLPTDMSTASGEANFGRQLMIISIIWIVATVAVGILLVLAGPLLTGVF